MISSRAPSTTRSEGAQGKEIETMFSDLIQAIGAHRLRVHSIECFRNGVTVDAHDFAPADSRFPVYSSTKSFTSAAISIAADEGKLDTDTPLAELLERRYLSFVPAAQREAFCKLPLSRFLTMSLPGYPFRPEGTDWLENVLSLPMDYTAAPAFHYSNIPAYLAGVACANAVGMHVMDYLKPRLLEPLGIHAPVYQNDPQGRFMGATGMHLTLRELRPLGQLYLQKGVYAGERLISAERVQQAVSPQIPNHKFGYGYYFWCEEHDGFFISGKWGQNCLVYPEKQLILTTLADEPEQERADLLFSLIKDYAGQL